MFSWNFNAVDWRNPVFAEAELQTIAFIITRNIGFCHLFESESIQPRRFFFHTTFFLVPFGHWEIVQRPLWVTALHSLTISLRHLTIHCTTTQKFVLSPYCCPFASWNIVISLWVHHFKFLCTCAVEYRNSFCWRDLSLLFYHRAYSAVVL